MKNSCPSTVTELIDQYKILHNSGHYGSSGEHKAKWIVPYLNFNHQSVLDYGCGRCNLVNTLGIKDTYKYDPAIPEFSIRPNKQFDLVICTDVLEHVSEDGLNYIFKDIRSFSDNVFFTICTRLASKILPDGRNAHQTVKPADWWQKKIKRYFMVSDLILQHNEGCHIKTWR